MKKLSTFLVLFYSIFVSTKVTSNPQHSYYNNRQHYGLKNYYKIYHRSLHQCNAEFKFGECILKCKGFDSFFSTPRVAKCMVKFVRFLCHGHNSKDCQTKAVLAGVVMLKKIQSISDFFSNDHLSSLFEFLRISMANKLLLHHSNCVGNAFEVYLVSVSRSTFAKGNEKKCVKSSIENADCGHLSSAERQISSSTFNADIVFSESSSKKSSALTYDKFVSKYKEALYNDDSNHGRQDKKKNSTDSNMKTNPLDIDIELVEGNKEISTMVCPISYLRSNSSNVYGIPKNLAKFHFPLKENNLVVVNKKRMSCKRYYTLSKYIYINSKTSYDIGDVCFNEKKYRIKFLQTGQFASLKYEQVNKKSLSKNPCYKVSWYSKRPCQELLTQWQMELTCCKSYRTVSMEKSTKKIKKRRYSRYRTSRNYYQDKFHPNSPTTRKYKYHNHDLHKPRKVVKYRGEYGYGAKSYPENNLHFSKENSHRDYSKVERKDSDKHRGNQDNSEQYKHGLFLPPKFDRHRTEKHESSTLHKDEYPHHSSKLKSRNKNRYVPPVEDYKSFRHINSQHRSSKSKRRYTDRHQTKYQRNEDPNYSRNRHNYVEHKKVNHAGQNRVHYPKYHASPIAKDSYASPNHKLPYHAKKGHDRISTKHRDQPSIHEQHRGKITTSAKENDKPQTGINGFYTPPNYNFPHQVQLQRVLLHQRRHFQHSFDENENQRKYDQHQYHDKSDRYSPPNTKYSSRKQQLRRFPDGEYSKVSYQQRGNDGHHQAYVHKKSYKHPDTNIHGNQPHHDRERYYSTSKSTSHYRMHKNRKNHHGGIHKQSHGYSFTPPRAKYPTSNYGRHKSDRHYSKEKTNYRYQHNKKQYHRRTRIQKLPHDNHHHRRPEKEYSKSRSTYQHSENNHHNRHRADIHKRSYNQHHGNLFTPTQVKYPSRKSYHHESKQDTKYASHREYHKNRYHVHTYARKKPYKQPSNSNHYHRESERGYSKSKSTYQHREIKHYNHHRADIHQRSYNHPHGNLFTPPHVKYPSDKSYHRPESKDNSKYTSHHGYHKNHYHVHDEAHKKSYEQHSGISSHYHPEHERGYSKSKSTYQRRANKHHNHHRAQIHQRSYNHPHGDLFTPPHVKYPSDKNYQHDESKQDSKYSSHHGYHKHHYHAHGEAHKKAYEQHSGISNHYHPEHERGYSKSKSTYQHRANKHHNHHRAQIHQRSYHHPHGDLFTPPHVKYPSDKDYQHHESKEVYSKSKSTYHVGHKKNYHPHRIHDQNHAKKRYNKRYSNRNRRKSKYEYSKFVSSTSMQGTLVEDDGIHSPSVAEVSTKLKKWRNKLKKYYWISTKHLSENEKEWMTEKVWKKILPDFKISNATMDQPTQQSKRKAVPSIYMKNRKYLEHACSLLELSIDWQSVIVLSNVKCAASAFSVSKYVRCTEQVSDSDDSYSVFIHSKFKKGNHNSRWWQSYFGKGRQSMYNPDVKQNWNTHIDKLGGISLEKAPIKSILLTFAGFVGGVFTISLVQVFINRKNRLENRREYFTKHI